MDEHASGTGMGAGTGGGGGAAADPAAGLEAQALGVGLRWREAGAGSDVVLFVHGFPFSGAIWDEQLAAVPQGWRFLAPDLPGFGGTPPLSSPLTMEILARELVCFLEELGVGRVVVCGLSMGGYVAFALWRLARERVRALVLADTKAAADTPEGRHARYENAQRARREGVAALTEDLLAGALAPSTRERRPEVVQRLRAIMAQATPAGVAGALEGMAERPDSTEALSTIDVPALVIVGAEDALAPPHEAEAMAGAIPGARVVTIPGAGHVTCLEQPAAFNAALNEFLQSVPAAGG